MDLDKIAKYRKDLENEAKRKQQLDSMKEVASSVKESKNATQETLKEVTKDIAKSTDIQEVIHQLKETQLASYLSGSQKQSVILADSTDLGAAVAGLGVKLDELNKSLLGERTDKQLATKIEGLKSELSAIATALSNDTDSELIDAINSLRPLLENINVSPIVNVPQPKVTVEGTKVDMSPLSKDIKEMTKAVKSMKQPTLDVSELLDATNKVDRKSVV